MRIALDGLVFQTRLTGVGKYYLGIILDLRAKFPKAEFILISNKHLAFLPEELMDIKVVLSSAIFQKLKYIVWLKFFASGVLKNLHIDYYFSCNTFLPKLNKNVKTIGIIHDLNYKVVPETMPFTNYLAHKIFMRFDAKNLDFVIANSEATSKKALQYLGTKTQTIINPKINDIFFIRNKSEVKDYLKDLNITFPYILSVATQEPRKNIDLTIKAFHQLSNKLPYDMKLILVGGKGWKNRKVEEMIASDKNRIVQLDYVSDIDLAYLYNGASIFVFPSRYEGFGIPVREALKSGCKVVAANIDELSEVGGDECTYFNLNSLESYKEAILNTIKKKCKVSGNFNTKGIEQLATYLKLK